MGPSVSLSVWEAGLNPVGLVGAGRPGGSPRTLSSGQAPLLRASPHPPCCRRWPSAPGPLHLLLRSEAPAPHFIHNLLKGQSRWPSLAARLLQSRGLVSLSVLCLPLPSPLPIALRHLALRALGHRGAPARSFGRRSWLLAWAAPAARAPLGLKPSGDPGPPPPEPPPRPARRVPASARSSRLVGCERTKKSNPFLQIRENMPTPELGGLGAWGRGGEGSAPPPRWRGLPAAGPSGLPRRRWAARLAGPGSPHPRHGGCHSRKGQAGVISTLATRGHPRAGPPGRLGAAGPMPASRSGPSRGHLRFPISQMRKWVPNTQDRPRSRRPALPVRAGA